MVITLGRVALLEQIRDEFGGLHSHKYHLSKSVTTGLPESHSSLATYRIADGGRDGREANHLYDGPCVKHAVPPVHRSGGVELDQERAKETLRRCS